MPVLFSSPPSMMEGSTHYCPGCTHGVIHRLIGETLDELCLTERAVGVAPVGCSVLIYHYINIDFQEAAPGCTVTWQTVAALMRGEADEAARGRIIREMEGRKIELQVASYSAGRLEPYRAFCAGGGFPVSDRIHDCGLALPAHSMMDEEDAAAVCDALLEIVRGL